MSQHQPHGRFQGMETPVLGVLAEETLRKRQLHELLPLCLFAEQQYHLVGVSPDGPKGHAGCFLTEPLHPEPSLSSLDGSF